MQSTTPTGSFSMVRTKLSFAGSNSGARALGASAIIISQRSIMPPISPRACATGLPIMPLMSFAMRSASALMASMNFAQTATRCATVVSAAQARWAAAPASTAARASADVL